MCAHFRDKLGLICLYFLEISVSRAELFYPLKRFFVFVLKDKHKRIFVKTFVKSFLHKFNFNLCNNCLEIIIFYHIFLILV